MASEQYTRKHASVYELPLRLPHAAGLLVQDEVRILRSLTGNPEHPYAVVLGGCKSFRQDRGHIESHREGRPSRDRRRNALHLPCSTGIVVSESHFLKWDQIDTVNKVLTRAKERGIEVLLPTDLLVTTEFKDLPPKHVKIEEIGADEMGLDIGPESAARYAAALSSCKTVFWNGPMGVFEFSHYKEGTRAIASAMTRIKGLTVVGGGDSAAAIRALGFKDEEFGYISTGGGASLEYLEGKELPGLVALQ